ncbi:mitochondrial transcription termination factorfamily protein [Striga asiatica]|uniref:Mitochondrial transcription termination factorfamily protein n=1 Tax=Striga asiatica TaxID=4170 RepID=A0A5A7R8M2_STRAF|nr:mitochondrial transcription termination factorfamily protein [Striga asiatica]GER54075.1 mitochondrial transcription termination factorfamily protein [Striga asiatica]
MASRIIRCSLLHHIRKSSSSTTNRPFSSSAHKQSKSLSPTTSSNERNLISLSNLFQRYGFPHSELPDFLKKNEFLLSSNESEIEKSFQILLSLKPSQDFLVSTVTGCPRVLHHEILENWELGFKRLGICNNLTELAIRNVLEIATKFGLSPDCGFRRVEFLKGLGFSGSTVTRVLEAVPMVITSNEDKILSKVEFLMGIGIRAREHNRIFNSCPQILSFAVTNRLKPLLDEFEALGFSSDVIRREVLREPKILGLENGELSECVEMLRKLKCRAAIRKNIYQDGEVRAGYRVKMRIDCLRKHGLIYRDAFTVLWKEPRVILYEIDEIDKKIEFLVREMKFDVQCLVEVPEYLGVNFEKQIVPRFRVVEHLRASDGLGDEVGLRDLVRLSRMRFYNMYVKPYPECEKIYGRYNSGGGVARKQHPTGMWKLFRPQKYPETSDDVTNVKAYVESLASLP